MMQKYFLFLGLFVALTTCAMCAGRYSTSMQSNKELPGDLNTAHEVIVTQSEFIRELSGKNEKLAKELAEAHAAYAKLLAGNRSEKFVNPAQQLLDFPEDKEMQAVLEAAKREAEEAIEKITYTRTKKKEQAKLRSDLFPVHLRRQEITVAIPADKQQLIDDGKIILLGYEPKEVLCHLPSEIYVKRYMEPVFATAEKPETEAFREEMPAAMGEQGKYDSSVAASIINGKFGLHIPYYRLQDMFSASGWTPSRSTIDYQTDLAAEAIEELPKLMIRRLLASQYIGMDDTSVTLIMPSEIPEANEECSRSMRLIEKMLEAKGKGEKSLEAKMWAYSGGEDAPYDIFDFRVSRHRDGPAEFLENYQGHVMADCYSGNLSVILASGNSMTRMACMSHARRHVYEAKDHDLTVSAMPLAMINQLYDIERRALEWSVEARTEVRQRESKLILDRLGDWLDGIVAKSVLPESNLGKALKYLRNHWQALNEYASDGRLPIDNNWVERLMKRVAVGKKNWLFVGSLRAGMRNADLMTLVASAHRHDLDVYEYLKDVIEHLNRGTASPSELLPEVWKASHPEAIRTYREVERRDKADQARLRNAKRRLIL
jgi:transposase